MKAIKSAKFILTLLSCLLLSSGLARAAGSIPVDDPKLQSYFAQSELFATMKDAGLALNSCAGIRLGRHWRHLAGTRIGPYKCLGFLSSKLVTLIIETQVIFLDDQGKPLEDDNAFELAVAVDENATLIRVEETLLKHR